MWCCGFSPRCLRTREWNVALLALVCFGVVVAGSSCAHTPVMTDIKSFNLLVSAATNWDADPEPDGIQFILRPLDDTGFSGQG